MSPLTIIVILLLVILFGSLTLLPLFSNPSETNQHQ
jgi:hypothetical protein